MRSRRPSLAVLALTTAGLLLAGCSSSGEQTTEAAERTSPLSEYLDAVWGGDLSEEEQQAQFEDQNRRTEELVAACMQDQGFEYVPNTQNGGVSGYAEGDVWEPDDRAWVEQWGYGAVNWPGRDDVPEDTGEEYVDPNEDYVASLSESEQTAFYEALNGPQPTEEEMAAMEDGTFEYDWEAAGCYGAAQHETQEADDLSQSDEFAPLFDALDEFWQSSQDSPEMAELDRAWADCMDAAGHGGFRQQYDAQNSIYDAQNELYESASTPDGEYTEPDQAAMDALGEEEITLALADLDCREETDYRDRQLEISDELEQQFVDDHRSELEALRAAAEQQD